jgi:hypothetical protein
MQPSPKGGLIRTPFLFLLIIPVLLLGCTSEAAGPDASAAIRPDFLVRNPEAADLNNNGFVCSQESSGSSLKPMPNFPGVYVDDSFDTGRFFQGCPPSYVRISI